MKAFLILSLCSLLLNNHVSSQKNDTIKPDDILMMSFEEMLNTEIISESKTSQKINEVPATVRIITSEQIKERGYFTLDEALSDLAGFQFRNIQGFNSYSFLRGIPNQNNLILVLVDGVQINELNSGGFYGGGQYNLSDVNRIEVIYGPATVFYGTNAISGIINIITHSPEENSSSHVSGAIGNFATYNTDFGITHFNENKKSGFRLSGMYKSSEKANLKGENGDNNWTENMENFENDISLSGKYNYKDLSVSLLYQEKKSSRTTNYKTIDDIYLDRGTLWDIYFLNGLIKYDYSKMENWSSNSKIYYRNATVKSTSIGLIEKGNDSLAGNQVGYFRPNYLVGLENQFNYNASKKIGLTLGVTLEYEALAESFSKTFSSSQDTLPPRPENPNKVNNKLACFFIQSKYNIVNWLSLTIGGRGDFSSNYGNVFTPRTAIIFTKNKFSAKLLYNEAYRAPKPWDFTSGLGNNNLKPERMKSGEAILSYHLSKKLSIETSIYKNIIRDILTKEIILDDWQWINKDEIQTIGTEIDLHYVEKNYSWYLNYTYNNSRDQDDNIVPEIAEHSANAGFSYSITPSLKLNFRSNYLGERKSPTEITSTGTDIINEATIFHASLTFVKWENFDVNLKVNNLFNTKYYHPSNRPPDRYRQAQRGFLLRTTFKF